MVAGPQWHMVAPHVRAQTSAVTFARRLICTSE